MLELRRCCFAMDQDYEPFSHFSTLAVQRDASSASGTEEKNQRGFSGRVRSHEEPLPKDADEKAYQTRILDLVKEMKSLALESCTKQQSCMSLDHEILRQKAESNSFFALDLEKKSKQLSYRGAVELVSNELYELLPNRRV